MTKKIAILGATGFLGRKISEELISRGNILTILTRSTSKSKLIIPNAYKHVEWSLDNSNWHREINDQDVIINLAGENIVGKRWSANQKEKLINSRVNSTRSLVDAIISSEEKPKLYLSASAIGYYGNRTTPVDENSQRGRGFLPELVEKWEKESLILENHGVRRVAVRIGIVLDKNEGALAKMILPYKLFVGGPIGSGEQYVSWIHLDDLVNIFDYAIENENLTGIVNGVSVNPVTMNEFAQSIGNTINRPSLFKVPSAMLKLLMGESASVVLEGAKVIPQKLIESSFEFRFRDLNEALADLLKK